MTHSVIIEDKIQIRDNLVRFLRLEGHTGESVPDGLAGLMAMRTKPPQRIIGDFMLPRRNGFQLLAALQSNGALKTVSFSMLCTSAQPRAAATGHRTGSHGL